MKIVAFAKQKIVTFIQKKQEGEQEMAALLCPNCRGEWSDAEFVVRCTGKSKMWGIIQCTRCLHEMPFSMYHDRIQQLDVALPGIQSDQLHPSVPEDIKNDVREAERANFAQCYKACVAMCRRSLQLSLIDKGINDGPLGIMIQAALDKTFIDQKTFDLATSIKGYGDIGLHRKEILEPKEVELVIYAAVRMVNELFPQP